MRGWFSTRGSSADHSNLDGRWLDRTAQWLEAHGSHPYALLETSELTLFAERFAGAGRLAALERPPIATYVDAGKVMIFDLSRDTPAPADLLVNADALRGWRAFQPVRLDSITFAASP